MKEFSKTFYLAAGECNPQGEMPLPLMVNRIIEVATLHANSWGVGYRHLIAQNHAWVLSSVVVEMERFPRVDTDYTLTTWIEDYNRHFSQRNFEIRDGEGKTLGYARTIWVVIDLLTRTSVDISSLEYIRVNITGHPCPIAPRSRLRPLEEGSDVTHRFGYAECDFNRHVNTVRYLELILNRFTLDYFDRMMPRRLELIFSKETHYGEEALLRMAETAPDDWQVNIIAGGDDHVRSRVMFVARN